MAVSKIKLYGIITNRLDFDDTDHFLTGLQHFLPGTMSADFGRGRINALKFTRKLESFAIGESDIQYSGFLV